MACCSNHVEGFITMACPSSVSVVPYLLPSLLCVDVANVSAHKAALGDVIQRTQPPTPAQDQYFTSDTQACYLVQEQTSKSRLLTETQSQLDPLPGSLLLVEESGSEANNQPHPQQLITPTTADYTHNS